MSSSSKFSRDEAKVGDILRSNTVPGSQMISRAWHFRPTTAELDEHSSELGHKIVFRHCSSSGKWILIIDGVPYMKGCEPIINRKFAISFTINVRLEAVITVTGKTGLRMGYSHNLTIQDRDIEEVKGYPGGLSVGDNPPVHISIPDSRVYYDGFKNVTLFQIFIRPIEGGQIIVERRFSEFITLNNLIKAMKDKHVGILPTLPGRVFTPWTDQQSLEFTEERRTALQFYLQSLLTNLRVCAYTEFLCFLGLDPITGNPLQVPLSASLMGSDDDDEGFPL